MKTTSYNSSNKISIYLFGLISLLGFLSVMIFSSNAQADNRYYQHRPIMRPMVHHNYQYVYYPAQQAYYAPQTKLWYWNSGNRWQSAYYAPTYLNLNFRVAGIPIQLQSALPYQEHAYVSRQYNYVSNHDRGQQYRYVKERNDHKYEPNRRHHRKDHND